MELSEDYIEIFSAFDELFELFEELLCATLNITDFFMIPRRFTICICMRLL